MNEPRTLEETYPEACLKLKIWGYWSVDRNNLGYPNVSIEQAAIEGAGIDTRGSGMKTIPDCPDAEEMELRLIELSKRNLNQFIAIKLYFSTSMTIKTMARRMNLCREKARSTLREGVAWIDGGLH